MPIFGNEVDYLRYCIDKTGLHTMSSKIEAIIRAPTLKNVHEIQAL